MAWLERELAAHGVDVRLRVHADADAVAALSPDVVILATGAPDLPVDVTGDGSVEVITADEVFTWTFAGTAVVYDVPGAIDAMLIAEHLAATGAAVTLATSRIHVGEGEGVNTLYPMIRTLAEAGVRILERTRPAGVADGRVHLDGIFGEPSHTLPADVLVTWNGGAPDLELRTELAARGIPHTVIGGALRPRRLVDATAEAKDATDGVPGRPPTVHAVRH